MSAGTRKKSNATIRHLIDTIIQELPENNEIMVSQLSQKIKKKNKCLNTSHARIGSLLRDRPDLKSQKHGVWIKIPVIAAILILFMSLPVSGYTLSNVKILPETDIIIGTPLFISFTMKFEPTVNLTFDNLHAIQVATTLQNPQWTRTTVLNGQASKPVDLVGNAVNFYGYDLAYPLGTYEWLNITLTGTAPNFGTTSRTPVLKIAEIDETNSVISTSVTTFERTVINPDDLPEAIYLAEGDLKTFQNHINEKKLMGLDVSAAKAQYADAEQTIAFIKTLTAKDFYLGKTRLQAVRNTIQAGEDHLEKMVTEQEIEKAAGPIASSDNIIEWFVKNESTRNYPGLNDVKIKRQNAANLISNASLAMTARDYELARAKANEAYLSANSTYYAALGLQDRAKDPLTPIKDNLVWIGLGIVGIVVWLLFRKKPKKKNNKKKEVTK